MINKQGSNSYSFSSDNNNNNENGNNEEENIREEFLENHIKNLVQNSPFLDITHPITLYEALKIIIMFPIVLFKWFIFGIALLYSSLILVLLLIGSDYNRPHSAIRSFLIDFWIRSWCSFVLIVCGYYYIPIKGWNNMIRAKKCRSIIIFNHESYLDPLIFGALLPPSGISKAGVANIPFINRFGRALHFIFIKRKGTHDQDNIYTMNSEGEDLNTIISQRAADPRYNLLMIAPEATTKAVPCLLKFRKGAFSAGRPVTPVLLKYTYTHFNPGWGITNIYIHILRLLSQFINHLSVEILPPFFPRESENPVQFAARVRLEMSKALNVPMVEQSVVHERELMRYGVTMDILERRIIIPTNNKVEKKKM